MNDFKKQLDQIDIPKSLHKRSLQGIEQAKKEQQISKRWMPKILTVAVTLAAGGFIALSVGEEHDTRQQQSSSLLDGSLSSPILYWSIAIFLMIMTIFVVKMAIRKGMDKTASIAMGFIMALLLGNSAFYLQNQLPRPITVPLVQDFFSSNESYDFTIHYITNKSDRRFVKYLQANNLTLQARDYGDRENKGISYYPADVTNESSHQFMRAAYFVGNKEEIKTLINSTEVFLVLDDGEKLSTTLRIDFEHSAKELKGFIGTSGSYDGDRTATFVLTQDVVLDTVNIPEVLNRSISFTEIKVNEIAYTEKDFPIAVKKGQRVTISFHISETGMDVHAKVGVSGPDGMLPIWIQREASFKITKIREEIERHD
ncbi:hypothetical protein FJQ98_09295 [Lysinibacillus agricola]|uniref:DUF4179 domain-containing protein n=1 Tax=Lysinibacillus agricola TaxID=2590012 RepID=A0ABX7AW32_9BACI|nr:MULTISPECIES: hypothetical protein [Lysinibacillus]KOS63472.1 hypothetical protein AN161_07385 [Lysinibacillus sp. FJAT-14222]QQP14187.1 hypothetical protein FJQ98_09295 [Lysinibacillus agricola]